MAPERQLDDDLIPCYPSCNAITGRGERQVWDRLGEQYPEVEGLVDYVRFSDKNGDLRGKPTPVVDLEGWLQILALLPGAAGKRVQFCGHYVSANSLFAAHGAGATASGGNKRVSDWWNSFTDAFGESELLRHMAEIEGREPFREVSWKKIAEIPADYFLCQSSPLVIKVGGMAEMEGREPFREVKREKAAEIPADYFLCQFSPVVDLEGWLQILALLPGAAGKRGQAFRQLQVLS